MSNNLRLVILCCAAILLAFIGFSQKNLLPPALKSPSPSPPRKKPSSLTLVKRYPTALLIGVKKGGTRALIGMLDMHPRIVATTTEVHFFDNKYGYGLPWYRAQMPLSSPDQVVMEKSPAYFVTNGVPERVSKLSKKMRLLLLLRNPVTRIVSDYMQGEHRRRGHALRLSELSAKELQNVQSGLRRRVCTQDGRIKTKSGAVRIGMYEMHLQKWLKLFPRNQIFVASAEEFASNPIPVLRKAEHFLGVDVPVKFPWELWVKPNKTKKFYCMHQRQALATNVSHIRCLEDTKGREHIPLPVDLEEKLYTFYAPLNEKLFALLGQRFNWTRPNQTNQNVRRSELSKH